MNVDITWLGHASLKLDSNGKTIYVDPWKITGKGKDASLVLITHSHHDHCSPEDISKIIGQDTVIAGPQDALSMLKGGDKKNMLPGETIDMGWVAIAGTPAYNMKKDFHPAEKGWLGFIIKFPDTSIYIAGDTDFTPEMRRIKADIVILPVGGTYTMDAENAAMAVNAIRPKKAIPVHFGDIVGSVKDAEKFQQLVQSGEVQIPTVNLKM